MRVYTVELTPQEQFALEYIVRRYAEDHGADGSLPEQTAGAGVTVGNLLEKLSTAPASEPDNPGAAPEPVFPLPDDSEC